jgi:hypothetical protein
MRTGRCVSAILACCCAENAARRPKSVSPRGTDPKGILIGFAAFEDDVIRGELPLSRLHSRNESSNDHTTQFFPVIAVVSGIARLLVRTGENRSGKTNAFSRL